MKNYKSFMLAAVILPGIISCSSDEKAGDAAEESRSLLLNTNISQTRGIIDNTNFSDGDQVSLYVTGAVNNVTKTEAILSEGKWQLSPTPLLGFQRAGVGGYANLTEDISPNTQGDQNDILLGVSTLNDGLSINWDNPIANMQFFHVLSKVSFQLKQHNGKGHLTKIALVNVGSGNAISTEIPVKMVTSAVEKASIIASKNGLLKANNNSEEEKTKAKAAYDQELNSLMEEVYQDIYSYNKTAHDLIMPVDIQLSEESAAISLLAIPTSFGAYYGNQVQLQLVIDDKTYSINFPETVWQYNTQYTYPIDIDLSSDRLIQISFGTLRIEKWGTSTVLDEQVIPTYMD